MKRNFYILLIGMTISLSALAQNTPAWKLEFSSSINWHQLTPLGDLVVSAADGLYGIQATSGSITWKIDQLANISQEEYQLIDGTLLAQIDKGSQVIILDPQGGHILFDSKEAGIGIMTKNILYESGTLLIYGMTKPLQFTLAMVDLNSGKTLWTNDEIFTAGKKGLGGLMAAMQTMPGASEEAGTDSENKFDLFEDGASAFVFGTGTGIYKVDTKSGNVIWKADLPQPKGMVGGSDNPRMIPSMDGKHFYFANYNYVQGYTLADGKPLWKDVFKFSGSVSYVVNNKQGILVLPQIDPKNNMLAPTANLVDYSSGTGYWGNKGKGIKLDGGVSSFRLLNEKELLITMEKADKSYLNVIDLDQGTLKFDKSLKIKGYLDYTEITPKGVLYITIPTPSTKGEINMFSLETGEPLFPKSIESGRPLNSDNFDPRKFGLLTADAGDKLYVYANGDNTLYEVNKSEGTYKILNDRVAFEKKENASSLEVRENGLLLSSDQNIFLFDENGRDIFHQYYPAPDNPGWLKALHALDAINAALYSASASMYSAAFQEVGASSSDPVVQEVTNEVSDAFDQYATHASDYSKRSFQAMKARFNATTDSQDHIYMMTEMEKQKSGLAKAFEGQSFGLIRVAKETGEVIDIIPMNKDKDPSYQVDSFLNAIYYQPSPKEMVCYQF